MHEMSIAKGILEIVLSEAQRNGATQIKTVRIRAGELRGIVQEQLLFLWKFACKDTLAEGATLEIERVPIKARCQSCDHIFMVRNHEFICSECDSKDVDVTEGMELDVQDIEVE